MKRFSKFVIVLLTICLCLVGCVDVDNTSQSAITAMSYDTVSTETLPLPCDSYFCDGKQFTEVVKQFESAGFTNVIAIAQSGDSAKETRTNGSVIAVSINNNIIFSEGTLCTPDIEIKVYYVASQITENASQETESQPLTQSAASTETSSKETVASSKAEETTSTKETIVNSQTEEIASPKEVITNSQTEEIISSKETINNSSTEESVSSKETATSSQLQEVESDTIQKAQSSSNTEASVNTETEDDDTVWIPASGKKYHNKPTCSGMKNPTEVTIEEAEEQGYEPCKRCYKD